MGGWVADDSKSLVGLHINTYILGYYGDSTDVNDTASMESDSSIKYVASFNLAAPFSESY